MTRYLVISIFGILGLTSLGCTKGHPETHGEPNVELLQDMMEQDALKAQDFDPDARDTASSRLPPEGTVPVGFKPYPYHLNAAAAAEKLKNPYAGDSSPEMLNRGRVKFETYCACCHGYEAKGDGPVSVKMALKPPPLVSDKIIGVKDGAIFHIISDGQGVMSSYAYQLVDENDRWAIVNYVRSLQKLSKTASK
jgi:mono/diheme cytochrome c family protein